MKNIIKKIIIYLDNRRIVTLNDKLYLKILYKDILGKELSFKNPKTFNEKLQWLKLYNRNPIYTKMVDKCEVKEYVGKIIGMEHIIPTLGVWDKYEDIDFKNLPNQFVLKCTHDSGGIIICRDKEKYNYLEAKNKVNKCLKNNYYYSSREWPYKNVKPRIIIEKYMHDEETDELRDYKFYCFNGKPIYLYVSEGLENHSTAKIGFFDMNFKPAPFGRSDYKKFDENPKKPYNFEEMKKLAEKLSKNIPFVRVDLYDVNRKIYFGELTFSPCGGFMPFEPIEYDQILGDMLRLPKEKIIKKNEK